MGGGKTTGTDVNRKSTRLSVHISCYSAQAAMCHPLLLGGMTATTCSHQTWNEIKCVGFGKRSVFLSKSSRDFSSSSRLASPFSLPWTFGLALKNMGGICFKIDILMLNFYCHGFCSCAFQILHLFVSELWMYRKNVTIVAEH